MIGKSKYSKVTIEQVTEALNEAFSEKLHPERQFVLFTKDIRVLEQFDDAMKKEVKKRYGDI